MSVGVELVSPCLVMTGSWILWSGCMYGECPPLCVQIQFHWICLQCVDCMRVLCRCACGCCVWSAYVWNNNRSYICMYAMCYMYLHISYVRT